MVQLVLPSRQSKPRLCSDCQSTRTSVVGYIRRAKVHSPGWFQSDGSGKLKYSQAGYWRNGRCPQIAHTNKKAPSTGTVIRRNRIYTSSICDGPRAISGAYLYEGASRTAVHALSGDVHS